MGVAPRALRPAIPHHADRCVGPAGTEAAAVPAPVKEARLLERIIYPIAIDKDLRTMPRLFGAFACDLFRRPIARQESVAMPVAHGEAGALVHNVMRRGRGGGPCGGGGGGGGAG